MSQTRNSQFSNILISNHLRDFSAIVGLGILLLVIHYAVPPFKRGFFCNDETIRYPHHESTISSFLCYSAGFGINLILILLIEYHNLVQEQKSDGLENSFPRAIYARRVYDRLLIWTLGAISSELITDISKVSAGRLRPHFIDVCGPVVKVPNRGEVSLFEFCKLDSVNLTYISPENYRCTKKDSIDIRKSFMSGHSSFSAYSAIFAVLYIQQTIDITKFGLTKHSVQVALISMTFYTGLSRVSDYKHHWQDVLVGLIQGTAVASFISLAVVPNYLRSLAEGSRRNLRVSTGDLGTELRIPQ